MNARWRWGLVLCVVAMLFVTGESFWIDEITTASFVRQSDFNVFAHDLIRYSGSESQMPLYMTTAWLWTQLVGEGEWRLRAMNLLWYALLLAGLARWIGHRRQGGWLLLMAGWHPFVLYYLNEARPYAMQIAGGAWLAVAVRSVCAKRPDRGSWRSFFLAAHLLCGSSLLGVFPLMAAFGICGVWWGLHRVRPPMRVLWSWMAVAFSCLPWGAYYAYTLLRGSGGASVWHPGWKNMVFSVYELLGFAGLGPGRIALREMAQVGDFAEMWSYLPGIFLLALVYAVAFGAVIRYRGSRKALLCLPVSGVLALSFLLLVTAAGIAHWPFWGRHLAPLLPLFLILLFEAMDVLPWTRFRRMLLGSLLVGFIFSSLVLRFSPFHRKDAYRAAATVASVAVSKGQTVWWAAYPLGAEYYGLTHAYDNMQRVWTMENPTGEQLSKMPRPDMIVLSKPDLFDAHGAVRNRIDAGTFSSCVQYPSFKIYSKR